MSFKTIRNAGLFFLLSIIIIICVFSMYNIKKISNALKLVITYEKPLRDKSNEITRILIDTKNAFEMYIHRDKITYDDLISTLDLLIHKSIALEKILTINRDITNQFKNIKVILINMEYETKHPDSDLLTSLKLSVEKKISGLYKKLFFMQSHISKTPDHMKENAIEIYQTINQIFRDWIYSFDNLMSINISLNDVIVPLDRVVVECANLGTMVGKDEKSAINALVLHVKHFKNAIMAYVSQEKVLDDTSDTLMKIKQSALRTQGDVQKSLIDVQHKVENRINIDHHHMIQLVARIQFMMMMGMVVGILFSIIGVIIMSRSLMKPISKLVMATQRLAKGELSYRVEKIYDDEIGQFAEALNLMAEELQVITVSRDELIETQAQLVQAAKLASIGELAAGVAHELNQPLMVIRTEVQLIMRYIEKDKFDSASLLEEMKIFENNTKKMMDIINHLREFSHQSRMPFCNVDIQIIIENALSMIKEQLRLNQITIKKEFQPNLPQIIGNANQLEQVFLNVITNARQAIESKNDGSGEIELKTDCIKPDEITIFIKDTGCGIPSEHLSQIFDPFYTTKEVGQGTGLGLSISYGIIKDHQGDIYVSETGDHGTTFVITLPIGQE